MDSCNFNILQLNCQGSFVAMCELGQIIRTLGATFALIQEPYSTAGCIRGLPGGMRSFTDVGVNAAVIVGNDEVDCTLVSASNFGVCVSAEGTFGRVFLCSVYCRFSASLEPYMAYLESVLLVSSGFPLILGFDANACSSMWYSKMGRSSTHYTNRYSRGIALGEWMITNNVHVLNEPSDLYTFDGPCGVSDIDVTASNSFAQRAFSFQWKVRDDWGVSDHNLIEVKVSHPQREFVANNERRRWNLNGIDWNRYVVFIREMARMVPLPEFSALSVDGQVSMIDEWLCSTNDAILGRRREPRPSKVKWWTSELSAKRRSVRHLRSLYQRGRRTGAEDLAQRKAAYRAEFRAYKEAIVRVKEAEWREFVRENSDDPWGKVYRICRGKSRRSEVSSLSVDGVSLSSWRDCSEVLLAGFFPESNVQLPLDLQRVALPSALGLDEVGSAIGRVRCRRSPGLDGITGEMCKSIWKAIPEYIQGTFSRCMSEGYFPRAWKTARVVVLLKSPDKIRSNPSSYRGISLLPVLGKVLERVMVSRLRQLDGAGISEFQYGFREGRSVDDALLFGFC